MMSKLLTKTLLRKAADTIGYPGHGGERYMCFAVGDVARNFEEVYDAFGALLESHEVQTDGHLTYRGVRHDPGDAWTPESQALRFDFLNLLACSLGRN